MDLENYTLLSYEPSISEKRGIFWNLIVKYDIKSCHISLSDIKQDRSLKFINNSVTLSTEERRKRHTCYVCMLKFKTLLELNNHKLDHNRGESDDDIFVEENCNKTRERNFEESTNLENSFKCQQCLVSFKSLQELKEHKPENNEKCAFFCRLCNKKYKTIINFVSHVKKHSNKVPDDSNMCSQSNNSETAYPSSLNNISPIDIEIKFSECDQYLNNASANESDNDMNRNPDGLSSLPSGLEETKLDIVLTNFSCNICYDVFNESEELNSHMDFHRQLENDSTQILGTEANETKKIVESDSLTQNLLPSITSINHMNQSTKDIDIKRVVNKNKRTMTELITNHGEYNFDQFHTTDPDGNRQFEKNPLNVQVTKNEMTSSMQIQKSHTTNKSKKSIPKKTLNETTESIGIAEAVKQNDTFSKLQKSTKRKNTTSKRSKTKCVKRPSTSKTDTIFQESSTDVRDTWSVDRNNEVLYVVNADNALLTSGSNTDNQYYLLPPREINDSPRSRSTDNVASRAMASNEVINDYKITYSLTEDSQFLEQINLSDVHQIPLTQKPDITYTAPDRTPEPAVSVSMGSNICNPPRTNSFEQHETITVLESIIGNSVHNPAGPNIFRQHETIGLLEPVKLICHSLITPVRPPKTKTPIKRPRKTTAKQPSKRKARVSNSGTKQHETVSTLEPVNSVEHRLVGPVKPLNAKTPINLQIKTTGTQPIKPKTFYREILPKEINSYSLEPPNILSKLLSLGKEADEPKKRIGAQKSRLSQVVHSQGEKIMPLPVIANVNSVLPEETTVITCEGLSDVEKVNSNATEDQGRMSNSNVNAEASLPMLMIIKD